MNINDYIMDENWDEYCRKIHFIINIENENIVIKNNSGKDKIEDLIYLVCLKECYINGPKCLLPKSDQCFTFENIDANIPLREYNQIYPTVIIELPEQYRSSLMSRYEVNPPKSIITHWRSDLNCLLASICFGKYKPIITMYISPKYSKNTIEESITLSMVNKDKDYLVTIPVLRMAVNLNLFAVNFGHESKGYENVKQHRFLQRKKPLEAKKDIFYYTLKQDIKLYKREYIKVREGTHASPKPHWRRGHYRNQPTKKGIILKFIHPIFVCAENFKGKLSDTETNYEN